jgi:DNA-binding transcriptional LysR family regulator
MALSWDLYRSFLAILKEGSLSAAARRLGLTQPTVGRHLEQLERELALPLFLRSPGGLTPTPAALALSSSAEAMEAAALALERNASAEAGDIAGAVRVTASEIVGVEVLPPMLAALGARHPRLAIELAITNANQDLPRRDADIAVRMARPTQAALVAKSVGAITLGLFARGDYLERHGTPSSISDLTDHALIGSDRDPPLPIPDGMGAQLDRDAFSYRCDSHVGQLAALRSGAGIGVCQAPLARLDERLVRVLPEVGFDLPVWVVMHEDQRGSRRIRAVFDHLVDGMETYARSG